MTVLNVVTLTGMFEDGSGNPLSGSASFTPSATVYAGGIPLLQPDVPVQAQIAGGQLETLSGEPLTLVATDNAGLDVEGLTGWWCWTVQVTVSGQTMDPWSFFLPHEPSTVDLWSLANTGTPALAPSVSYAPPGPGPVTSTTPAMAGIGGTCVFTPASTGVIMATVTGFWNTATASATGTLSARYGTGAAPGNGTAATGTRWGTGSTDASVNSARTVSAPTPFTFTQVITGLTVGTAYWFDLATSTASPSDAATITNVTASFTELPA